MIVVGYDFSEQAELALDAALAFAEATAAEEAVVLIIGVLDGNSELIDVKNRQAEIESAVNDVSDDATLSEALTSIQPAVQGVRSAWVQAQATVDCASAPIDDPLSNPQDDPFAAPVTSEPGDAGQPTDDAAS